MKSSCSRPEAMRILYHHRTLGDGAEGIHIRAMVDAFRALGHEVLVLGLAEAADREHRSHLVERVRSTLPRVAFEMASLGVNIPEYVQARREIGRFRPDLLYKRHARHDIAALAAARHCNVPAVLELNAMFTAPSYEQYEPLALRGAARFFERRALELATVAIAVSSPLARDARSLANAQVIVVPNGVDMGRFDSRLASGDRVRARYGLTARLTIGWTGILREWHGLELLLESLLTIPAASLLIVGDGPARSTLHRRVDQLGLQTRVVMTGRVAHHDVPDYLAAMDVAVVADDRTRVASPMKLLEYMSMARPVVAPRTENIRDLIDDGVDGLLFEPGDARDLTTQLRRLASDAPLRESLGRSARAKVELERNWPSVAKVVLAAVCDATPSCMETLQHHRVHR